MAESAIPVSRLTIEIGASSDNARREINRVTDALSRLRGNTNQRIKVDSKDVDKAHKKVGLLANTLNSLKRIAFYRVIRSAIKAVGDAMQEGQTNAYWYAKSVGDSTKYIADAYDSLASGGFKMQNQLGAAWATLKATITPILLEIVRLVTMAANALTQFFAILGGKGQYLKAIDYSKQWADTTARGAGAAKEWKNQLMGFDEINRLEEPSKGGGGGGSALPDYSNMFEESEISEWAKKVQEHLEAIKTLAKDIGLAILGWNAGTFLGQIPGIGAGLKYIVGLVMFVYGTIDFIKGYIDAWENGITFENLAKQIGDATIAVVGLGLAFGTTGASIGGLIFGAAMVIGALHDLAVNGKLTNEAFAALSVGIMAVGVTLGILTKSWILPLIAAIATVSLTIHHFWDNISGWLTGLADKLRESGHNALAGFVEAFVEWGDNAHKWVDEHIVTPFVTWLKTLLGIHSPSTVMESIGDNLIQGLWNGIEEKWKDFIGFFEGLWNELKSWWEGLSLGAFHIPSPHFEWTYTQASGNIAKALEFVGLPATIPNLNISWYAKGGIVDGATLIGAGEAGKEAIIPLERNTEWIGKVAAELNAQQARQASPNGDIGAALEDANDGVINAIFAVGAQVVQAIADNAGGGEIDWRQVSQQVTKYQRQFSRAYG